LAGDRKSVRMASQSRFSFAALLTHVTDEAAAEQFIAAANAFRMQKMGRNHQRRVEKLSNQRTDAVQARRPAKHLKRQHRSSANS